MGPNFFSKGLKVTPIPWEYLDPISRKKKSPEFHQLLLLIRLCQVCLLLPRRNLHVRAHVRLQKIELSQCGIFRIFLPLTFFVKSDFATGNWKTFKSNEFSYFPKKQNCEKGQFLTFSNQQTNMINILNCKKLRRSMLGLLFPEGRYWHQVFISLFSGGLVEYIIWDWSTVIYVSCIRAWLDY